MHMQTTVSDETACRPKRSKALSAFLYYHIYFALMQTPQKLIG
jgi:hypothetical protein